MGMFRIAKLVSAASASVFKRLASVARTLSGLVALLSLRRKIPRRETVARNGVAAAMPTGRLPHALASPWTSSLSGHPASLKAAPNCSEWDQLVRGIVSQAKQEIAEILPGWPVDVYAFESMDKQCYEFVIRAETPDRSRREWGGKFAVLLSEIHQSRSKTALAQSVLTRLGGLARDIQCKAPPAPEIEYR